MSPTPSANFILKIKCINIKYLSGEQGGGKTWEWALRAPPPHPLISSIFFVSPHLTSKMGVERQRAEFCSEAAKRINLFAGPAAEPPREIKIFF